MANRSRASSLIGKPIVTQAGERVETIDDVIFDPQTHRILCFVVEPGGWVGGTKILPWSGDCSITAHALIILSQAEVVLACKVPPIQTILENAQVVVGKQIVAPDARQIGILDDVHFDQHTGVICEYEIAGSSPTNHAEQRIVLQPDNVEFEVRRGTALWVSAKTADLIEHGIRSGE